MARKSKIQHHGSDNKPDMRNNTFPSEPPAEEEYKVGPGRPPREHQFKPGQSGNPNGTKRKAPSLIPGLKELFESAFNRCSLQSCGRSLLNRKSRRLVFALGSCLAEPAIPGLETHAFNVDTFEAATRLNDHIGSLPSRPVSTSQYNVLVVGGGLTGIEVATEKTRRFRCRPRWSGPRFFGLRQRPLVSTSTARTGHGQG